MSRPGSAVRGPSDPAGELVRPDRASSSAGAESPPLDARLLPAALCCWGVTIVALALGWVAGLLVAGALVVAAIGLWVLLLWSVAHRAERSRAVAVVALAAVVLGIGFALAGAWREHRAQTHPLRAAIGRSLHVVAIPVDDPKPLRGAAFGGEQQWVVRADLREYRLGGATVRAGGEVVILAAGQEWATLSPGHQLDFLARVSAPSRSDLTIVALRATGPPKVIGTLPWWQRAAGSMRASFASAAEHALSPDPAGLLPALVVGDVSHLSDEVRDEFKTSGLQHLCVVSGANFTILLTAVLFVVRALTLGPRVAAALAGATLLMFVIVARPDPSVLRAAAMGAITLLAVVTGRRKQALPALCAAVIGLLALWPALAVSAGFALSAVATGGLILLAPSWADWLRARGWWRTPAEVVAVSAGAFVVTTPLMVALTGQVSLVAIVANVLVAPVVAPITVIGAAGAVLSCLWQPLAEVILRCAAPPMWWVLFVAEHAAGVPGATVAVPGGLGGGLLACLLVVLGIAVLRLPALRRIVLATVLGVVSVLIPVRIWHPGWPPSGWALAVCDVGQGDGLALSLGDGSAVVIDTGQEPKPMRACLDRLHIKHIALLVLTHPHADHIGGLTGALAGRTVSAIGIGAHERPENSGAVVKPVVTHPEPFAIPGGSAAVATLLPAADIRPGWSARSPTERSTPPNSPADDESALTRAEFARYEITDVASNSIEGVRRRNFGKGSPASHGSHRPVLASRWEARVRTDRIGDDVPPAVDPSAAVGPRNPAWEQHRDVVGRSLPVSRSGGSSRASRRASEGHRRKAEFSSAARWPGRSADLVGAGAGRRADRNDDGGREARWPTVCCSTSAHHPRTASVPTSGCARFRWCRSPRSPADYSSAAGGRPQLRAVGTQGDSLSARWPITTTGGGRVRAVDGAGEVAGTAVGGQMRTERRSPGEEGSAGDGWAQVFAVAEQAGVPLVELSAGQVLRFGDVGLNVLAPLPGGPRPVPGDEGEGANARSVVIAADTAAGRVLLTGDIETPTQRALLNAGSPLAADILKLPHHGSRNTAPEFLAAVNPRLVVVSVGADNTFGHPNPGILTSLTDRGATIARTDRSGDILVLGTANDLRLITAGHRDNA
ncbi:ComEC/Rec2 family competence protein [Nocardia callitridis]|uniref:Competence protein ComEC n=1 Tax=Nocardia callitridis TaxID=648753 RepID=A0ABP9L2S5_9NOCA